MSAEPVPDATSVLVSGPGRRVAIGQRPHLVFCEGRSDEAFVEWLAKAQGYGSQVQTCHCAPNHSKSTAIRTLRQLTVSESLSSVALVFDEGDERERTLLELGSAISSAGLPPLESGQIVVFGSVRVGLWLTPLCLEDLLIRQVEDDMIACADALLDCAGLASGTREQRAKSRFLAAIAALGVESTSVGAALNAKYGKRHFHHGSLIFDPVHPSLERCSAFFARLWT